MNRQDVAQALEEIAAYLELTGEDAFRVRAYETAARALHAYQGDLSAGLVSGELAELKGVGPTTLEVVADVLRTGTSRMLEDLRDQVPPGLVEMLRISGLGVAKVRQIHEALQVDTVGELEEAARDGRLAALPRFGAKTAEKVLRGIQFLRQVSEFRLLHHALEEAVALARVLSELPEVSRAEVAGSVRRRRELIRDLDFVVELRGSPEALVRRLGRIPGVRESVTESDRALTLRFASGTVADVYWSDRASFGFQLVRATGAAGHLAALAARAATLGVGWTDAGLSREGKPVNTVEEADVYRALALPHIPPELREGLGEVDAAACGRLPAVLEPADIQGFIHCHSNYSDGGSTVRQWAEAGRAAGYAYVGITDHSQASAYAGGLAATDIQRQHEEIDAVNAELHDVRVLKGVEADILEDGSLDYTPELRATFDFVIASVHTRHGMSGAQMTDRILRAMDDPHMAILGHPTGRLLLSRDPYPLDLNAVFAKAAAVGVAVEINADPQRLDLDWRLVREAVNRGVTVSIGADAHSVTGMQNMELGVAVARKGWLTRDRVLNARPLEEFLAHAQCRRRGP